LYLNQQCSLAAKKATNLPGSIRQSIVSMSRDVILPFFPGFYRYVSDRRKA